MESLSQRKLQSKALQFIYSNYLLNPNDFREEVETFIDRLNSNLLEQIGDSSISEQDFKTTLQSFKNYPELVYYITILTDKNGISFRELISTSFGFVYNPLKINKLKLLETFLNSPLDYTPEDPNLDEHPGSEED